MREEGGRTPSPIVPPSPRGSAVCVGGEGSATDPGTSLSATTLDRWAAALRDALLTELTEDDFDVTAGAEPGVLEVSTDDWTLRVEHLHDDPDSVDPSYSLLPPTSPPSAWHAIDDEPEDPTRYRAARRVVMSPAIDRALARADAATDGALRAALIAGGDPFTQDLVAALPSS